MRRRCFIGAFGGAVLAFTPFATAQTRVARVAVLATAAAYAISCSGLAGFH